MNYYINKNVQIYVINNISIEHYTILNIKNTLYFQIHLEYLYIYELKFIYRLVNKSQTYFLSPYISIHIVNHELFIYCITYLSSFYFCFCCL